MSTDQIDDRELDRMLRELAPPVPDRSVTWERELRTDLLHVIEASGRSRPDPTFAVDGVTEVWPPSPDRRRRWVLVAAAAIVVVVGLLVVTGRWRDDPAPADQPIVPSAGEPARWPDVFPAFGVGDPRNADAVGSYSQLAEDDPLRSSALVARREGDDIVDGVTLHVVAGFDAGATALVADGAATIGGDEYLLFVEPGTPEVTVAVLSGGLDLLVTGADPVAFLESGAAAALVESRVDDGVVMFEVGELPEGYQLVVPPTPIVRGAVNAALRLPSASPEGVIVFVEPTNPLISVTNTGGWRRVDVGGAAGWASSEPGNTISWRVSPTTWSTVWGASSPEAALEIARALTFVDEETWRDRYGVDEPVFDDPPHEIADTGEPPPMEESPDALTDLAPPDFDVP